MRRPFGSIAAVLAVALIVAGGLSVASAGCAMSAPADLSLNNDQNIPGLDAAYDPVPGQPGKDAASREVGEDSGSTGEPIPEPDAGADAALGPTVPKPTAGEVLITEIMYTTTGPEPASEWFELHSLAPAERTLAGLLLKDGSNRTHVIVGPLTIAANGWVIFARNKAMAVIGKVPAGAIVYQYGSGLADNAGILLANGATGGLSLLSGATVIAAAPYGGWFTGSGASLQLKVLNPAQTTAKASWCFSATAWTAGAEKGTPGGASDCP